MQRIPLTSRFPFLSLPDASCAVLGTGNGIRLDSRQDNRNHVREGNRFRVIALACIAHCGPSLNSPS